MLGELGAMALAVGPELLTLLTGVWAAELEGVLEGCTFFCVVTVGCGLGGAGHGIKAPVF